MGYIRNSAAAAPAPAAETPKAAAAPAPAAAPVSAPAPAAARAPRHWQRAVDEALHILHAEWSEPLTIARLARRAGINKCYLKEMFRLRLKSFQVKRKKKRLLLFPNNFFITYNCFSV